jgi:hypothetical protein
MDNHTRISSFGKWLKPICTQTFQNHVDRIAQDKYTKKLTTLKYLKLFLLAQLHQREGLRAIATDVHCPRVQQALDLSSISAAQLSRKHNDVDPDLLHHVFATLVQQVLAHQKKLTPHPAMKVIDSTTISMCLTHYKWAAFRNTKAGIKLHTRLVFVQDGVLVPEKVHLTPAKQSDRSQMEALIEASDATYVFDRGYVDYQKFDDYCENGVTFVTRLKDNVVLEPLESLPIPAGSPITVDERIRLGSSQKRMKHDLRMIQTTDSKGNLVVLVTNRFDLESDEIGAMYRSRWAIETFFKWVKQHLSIKQWYGTSERAVQNQVWIALIAYCLLLLMKLDEQLKQGMLAIQRSLKALLWQPSTRWIEELTRPPSRTSAGRRRKITPVPSC